MTIGDKLRLIAVVPYGIALWQWLAGYTTELSGFFTLGGSALMLLSWPLDWAKGTRRRIAEEQRALSEQASTDASEQPIP